MISKHDLCHFPHCRQPWGVTIYAPDGITFIEDKTIIPLCVQHFLRAEPGRFSIYDQRVDINITSRRYAPVWNRMTEPRDG